MRGNPHRRNAVTQIRPAIALVLFVFTALAATAQEKSVKPGTNDPFKAPT